MKTNSKWISCILALMVIGTSAVWAQSSPQKQATAGLTATEVDQFMSVTDWGEVKFGKAFTFAGFSTDLALDLGAAFKAGPVYIGSWYGGNIGAFNGNNQQRRTTRVSEGTVTGTIGNINTGDTPHEYKNYDAAHNVAMLLGFGNVGITFGYRRSGKNETGTYYNGGVQPDNITNNSNKPNEVNSTTYSPKGYLNGASHTPFIGFGMNVGLGKMTLSPKASLDIAIQQQSQYGLKTVHTKKNKTDETTTKDVVAINGSYTGVIGDVSADLALGDSLNSVLTFGYNFNVRAYGNKEYTALDGSKHKVKGDYSVTIDKDEVKRTATAELKTKEFKADLNKKKWFKNTFSVGYAMKKDFTDRLAFHAGAELPFDFTTEQTITEMKHTKTVVTTHLLPGKLSDSNTATDVWTHPVKTHKKTTISFNPVLKAAISYAALPGRLFLNLGTSASVLNWTSITTKDSYNSFVNKQETTTEYKDKRKTVNTTVTQSARAESSTTTNTLNAATFALNAGLRWNLVENVGIDFVYFSSNVAAMNTANLGIFKLACTVKF